MFLKAARRRVLEGNKAAITDVAVRRRCHLLLAALPKRRPHSTYDMRNSHMLRETAARPLRGGTPHPLTPLFIIPGLDSSAPICQNKLPFRPTVRQYINSVVMTRAPPRVRTVIKLRSTDDRDPYSLEVWFEYPMKCSVSIKSPRVFIYSLSVPVNNTGNRNCSSTSARAHLSRSCHSTLLEKNRHSHNVVICGCVRHSLWTNFSAKMLFETSG